MPTGKNLPVTKEKWEKPHKKNEGLPKGISTEAQLWDEIFKKEVLEMPFLLLPLIYEIHGKSYPGGTKITPVGTEYSVERVITKDISSIRSDSTVWIDSQIFHFECEIGSHPKITRRVFEYDTQAALVYAESNTKEIPYRLRFPYSMVLFLEPDSGISDRLSCELILPVYSPDKLNSEKTKTTRVEYAVPALKVQDYSLQELREKRLLMLIPFTPIRFRTMLKKQKQMETNGEIFDLDNAKLKLTNFFHEIILILNEAVETEYICEVDRKDLLVLLRKAMIRVFRENEFLLEVVNHMTAPILELDREIIARQKKELTEKDEAIAERDTALAQKNIALMEKDTALMEKEATIQSQKEKIEFLESSLHPFRNWKNRLRKHKYM